MNKINLPAVKITLLLTLVICNFSCKKIDNLSKSENHVQNTVIANTVAATRGPTGFLVQNLVGTTIQKTNQLYSATSPINLNIKLTFNYQYSSRLYRMNIIRSLWFANGQSGTLNNTNVTRWLNEYTAVAGDNSGITVILNLENAPTPSPVPFVSNPADFTNFVGSVFSNLITNNLPPPIVVVENEENNMGYHDYDPDINDTDPDNKGEVNAECDKYNNQLEAVVNFCHNYNWAKDGDPPNYMAIPVSNAGFTGMLSNYMTYRGLVVAVLGDALPTHTSAQIDAALNAADLAFGNIAMPPHNLNAIRNFLKKEFDTNLTNDVFANNEAAKQVTMGINYLAKYEALKNIDNFYFNLHWYEPSKARGWLEAGEMINGVATPAWDDDPGTQDVVSKDAMSGALDQVFNYYHSYQPSGFTNILSNEIGQISASTDLTRALMNYIHDPFTEVYPFLISVWFDGDGGEPDALYKCKPLHKVKTYTAAELANITSINLPDYFEPIGLTFLEYRYQ